LFYSCCGITDIETKESVMRKSEYGSGFSHGIWATLIFCAIIIADAHVLGFFDKKEVTGPRVEFGESTIEFVPVRPLIYVISELESVCMKFALGSCATAMYAYDYEIAVKELLLGHAITISFKPHLSLPVLKFAPSSIDNFNQEKT
jgi:hypothetical protein